MHGSLARLLHIWNENTKRRVQTDKMYALKFARDFIFKWLSEPNWLFDFIVAWMQNACILLVSHRTWALGQSSAFRRNSKDVYIFISLTYVSEISYHMLHPFINVASSLSVQQCKTQCETRWIFYNYKNELQIVYSNADETNKSIRSQHSNAPIYLCFYIASLGKYIVLMVLRCSDIVSSGFPFFHSSGVTVRGGRSTEPNRTGLGVC